MSRPARWAFSPLDYTAHLLLCDGDHPPGVLKARCGHLLPVAAAVHEHPAGRTCPQCALVFLVDSAPGRFSRQGGTAAVPVSADAATRVTLRIITALPHT
jgi:hypothetical protein